MAQFPSRMLFRPIVRCPRIDPAPTIDGDLSDWEGIGPLPPLEELDGRATFADVFVAWNSQGLYIAERCRKPEGTVAVSRRRPHAGDALEVWIDTRATQSAHRATRFCHQFVLLPKGGGAGRLEAIAWQVSIRRARERPLECDPSEIEIASFIGNGFYTIEAHLPARILSGFEARAGARIGFNYLLHDVPGGRQFWAAPRGFPMHTDPSLWGLLELVEG